MYKLKLFTNLLCIQVHTVPDEAIHPVHCLTLELTHRT